MISDESVINYKLALHLIFLLFAEDCIERAVITSSGPCLEKTS